MPHHDTTSSVQCDAGSGSVACRTVRNFPNTGALLLSRTKELFCDTMINNKGNILLYISFSHGASKETEAPEESDVFSFIWMHLGMNNIQYPHFIIQNCVYDIVVPF